MDQTLVIVWACTWVAFTIMVVRLLLRKLRRQPFGAGDYLTMAAIFCLLARLGLIHVVLVLGSNNMSAAARKKLKLTPQVIYQREVGSKLTLVNRCFYNSFLWLQKLVLLEFFRKLSKGLSWDRKVRIVYWSFFAATYVVVQVVTFTECRPFRLYYQVDPDPGTCSRAVVQLLVLGVLNIVTDVMLLVLPLPVLVKVKRPLLEKLQLGALFCVGLFVIAVTVIRLPQNYGHSTKQVNRTTWASAEALAAAFVANAPTLYTLLRQRSRDHNAHSYPNQRSANSSQSTGWRRKTMAWRGDGHRDLASKDSEAYTGLNDERDDRNILVTDEVVLDTQLTKK